MTFTMPILAQAATRGTFDFSLLTESLLYAGAAVVFLALVFFIFVKVMPFSVKKEIEEDQNTALGIIMGSVILGVCYIIGRTFGG